MNLRPYSSLAAFLAHYAALRSARDARAGVENAAAPDDAAILDEMERVLAGLSTVDRDALRDASPAAAARRHRDRAQIHLHRLLAAHGLFAG